MAMILNVFCFDLISVEAADTQVSNEISVTSVKVSDEEQIENLYFSENGVNVRMEFIRYFGVTSKVNTYYDNTLYDSTEYYTKSECLSMSFYAYNPLLTRAYENRSFSSNTLEYSGSGNTAVDQITKTAIISALLRIAGMIYAPAEKVASAADRILQLFMSLGYATSDRVNLNYTVYKYWAHTIDGIDPVIYRTTYTYFYENSISDTNIMYTYNNPI